MKKLSILLAGLLVSSLIFTSCSKDEEETTETTLGTATITGYVFLQNDVTADAPDRTKQFAPSGTQVILKIDADDLAQDNNGNVNYPEKTYYTTVDANGKYSIAVDAGAKDVNILFLSGVDLELNFTETQAGTDTTYIKHWDCTNSNGFSVVEKQVVYQNLTYTGSTL